jgi:hypothetical protein
MTHRSSTSVLVSVASLLLIPKPADASFLPTEGEDKLATFLAILFLFIVPIFLTAFFRVVQILPETIAHTRHHPQLEAIRTLCLLSLMFGGLLWSLAWIWACTKPVVYKLPYGPDRHVDAERSPGHSSDAGPAEGLDDRLARLEARGASETDVRTLRADIDTLEPRLAGGDR